MIKIKTCAKTKKTEIQKSNTKSKAKQKEQSESQIKIGAALGPGFPAQSACLNCLPNLVFFFLYFCPQLGTNVLQLTFFTYNIYVVLNATISHRPGKVFWAMKCS